MKVAYKATKRGESVTITLTGKQWDTLLAAIDSAAQTALFGSGAYRDVPKFEGAIHRAIRKARGTK